MDEPRVTEPETEVINKETTVTESVTSACPMASGIPVYCAFDELVDIEKVVPNPRNPNRHPQNQIELLARIIRAQGWRAPITASTRSGFVVRGHGRLEAARVLQATQVPVDYQDYENEAAEWADLIADNRIAELAYRDEQALLDLLPEIPTDFRDLTGYTSQELEELLAKLQVPADEPEYTEKVAEGVKTVECPNCGHEFPV